MEYKIEPEESAEACWRRLALQFDDHRMQALRHLKAMLKDPEGHRAAAEKFLSEPPLSGVTVLAERINAIELAQRKPDLCEFHR